VVVVTLAMCGLGLGGCATLLLLAGAASDTTTGDREVGKDADASATVAGEPDEVDDVTDVRTVPDDLGGYRLEVHLRNDSSRRSDYWIDYSVESADGDVQYYSDFITVSGLDPGQATVATDDVPAEVVRAGSVVRIEEVERSAS
jgi:hypothetical protein